MHKRTSELLGRVNWLWPVAALSMAMLGCPGQELAPLSPCTVSAVTERVDQAGISDVDLLFMIDNSGSMATKQARLAVQLPRLLSVLTSGDRCAGLAAADCKYDDASMPKRNFTAVKSLHLGVVTSNAGGIDSPPTNQAAIASCQGTGDDGRLQNGTDIAINGVIAGNNEFQGYARDAVVIAPAPECADVGRPDIYQEFSTDAKNLDDVEAAFKCVSRVGVRGCPFEQQLESPWKALAPSGAKNDLVTFINGSEGQGDTYNQGFLRDDAILAVLLVTDEDDCAITDAGKVMFITGGAAGAQADTDYGALNLRCGLNFRNAELIQPTSRYVQGFQSLKPDNTDRVIFAAITGVPQDAIAAGDSLDEILDSEPMQFKENQAARGFPVPSCSNKAGSEVAYPPVRITEVARDFGEQGIIYSICEDDYAPALDLLIEKIANKLKGNCLPRKLNPDDTGKVNCEVFELLPSSNTGCDGDFGLDGEVTTRSIREGTKVNDRKACRMNQVPIVNGAPMPGVYGWYYDNFSPDLAEDCSPGEQQRITFQFADGTADLPSGAGATFECFQPVARIDKDAKGFDAVNTSCADENGEASDSTCADKSDGPGGYTLVCIGSTLTCNIECKVNPDCPPGWVCAGGAAATDAKYCQQPTCPQDNKPAAE